MFIWCWVSYFLKAVVICVIMLIVLSKSRKQYLVTHVTLMIEKSNNNCINPLMTKSKSHYSWWSVNQSVLVSSPFWGLWPDFTYVTGLIVSVLCLVGRPIRRVGVSVICLKSLSFVKHRAIPYVVRLGSRNTLHTEHIISLSISLLLHFSMTSK